MKLNITHENRYQTRRQALISLALQKDIAFPDNNSIVNELPLLNITYPNSIKSATVTFEHTQHPQHVKTVMFVLHLINVIAQLPGQEFFVRLKDVILSVKMVVYVRLRIRAYAIIQLGMVIVVNIVNKFFSFHFDLNSF